MPDTLFGDYAKLFFTGSADDPFELRARADGRRLAIKSRRDYRADLEKYILPDPICQKSIPLIRRNDSIDFRDRLIALFGFSRKAKRIFQAYKNVIHTVLEKGLTQIDSVNRLNMAYTKQKRPATTIGNVKILLKEENRKNPRIRFAVVAAGMTGLRAGEVRGIKWRDIDNEHNVIRVDREIIEIEGEKLPKWEKTRIQTALRGRRVNPELLRAAFGRTDEEVQEGYTYRELYDPSSQMEHTYSRFDDLTRVVQKLQFLANQRFDNNR